MLGPACCCGYVQPVDPCWECPLNYPRGIIITEIPENRALCYGTAAGEYEILPLGQFTVSGSPPDEVISHYSFGNNATLNTNDCLAVIYGWPTVEGLFYRNGFSSPDRNLTLDQVDFWVPYDPSCPFNFGSSPNVLWGTMWSGHGARKVIEVEVSMPKVITVRVITSEGYIQRPDQTDCFNQPYITYWTANRVDTFQISLDACPTATLAVPHLESTWNIVQEFSLFTGLPLGDPAPGWSDPNPHYSVILSIPPL